MSAVLEANSEAQSDVAGKHGRRESISATARNAHVRDV